MSASELSFEERLALLRQGGAIHREVREWIKPQLKPGIKLYEIANLIEGKVRELTKYDPENPLLGGSGFPTGISVNNCAAHWTPNPNQFDRAVILGENDVCKIDFGVQLQGQIIDAAFTHTFNPEFDPLLEAAYEATQAATKMSGPDAILGEIGTKIQEVIESYEFKGSTSNAVPLNAVPLNAVPLNAVPLNAVPLKPLSDLCGHNIAPYRIHGDKAIPNISTPSYRKRMEAGEIFAVETFPSSGTGRTRSDHINNSHYMINYQNEDWNEITVKNKRDQKVLDLIKKNYSTLAFCPRWVVSEEANKTAVKNLKKSLANLVSQQIVKAYPPLYDIKGSYVAQYEQTIAIKETGFEILS